MKALLMPYTISAIENILNQRRWCDENLPIENSLIAYDLMLELTLRQAQNRKQTIKQFFSSLPHSYTAVRQHYNRLINDGWIEHEKDSLDGRIKYVQPTAKFNLVMTEYFKMLDSTFSANHYQSP